MKYIYSGDSHVLGSRTFLYNYNNLIGQSLFTTEGHEWHVNCR